MTRKRLWDVCSTVLLVAVLVVISGTVVRRHFLSRTLERVLSENDSSRHRLTVIRNLVRKGADINTKDSRGYTALFTACAWGDEKLADEFLALGADIRLGDQDLKPVIVPAVWSGNHALVALLLERGANPNAEDEFGATAVYAARRNLRMVRLLKDYGAKF